MTSRLLCADHFKLDGALIVPLTAQGRVTVKIFQLNHPHRIAERLRLPKAP